MQRSISLPPPPATPSNCNSFINVKWYPGKFRCSSKQYEDIMKQEKGQKASSRGILRRRGRIRRTYELPRRSQWPRSLRYEPSSPARTLGSWVRIPLEAWMSVCVYSVCIVLCVGSGLMTGWSPDQGVLLTVYRIKKLKKRPWPKGP
jgi:hypothetical protein